MSREHLYATYLVEPLRKCLEDLDGRIFAVAADAESAFATATQYARILHRGAISGAGSTRILQCNLVDMLASCYGCVVGAVWALNAQGWILHLRRFRSLK